MGLWITAVIVAILLLMMWQEIRHSRQLRPRRDPEMLRAIDQHERREGTGNA